MMKSRLSNWLLWEYSVTMSILLVMWPLGRVWVNRPDAFYEALADGDIILFAGLLMMGVYVEFEYLKTSDDVHRNAQLYLLAKICHVGGILTLAVFAFLKYFLMNSSTLRQSVECHMYLPASGIDHFSVCDQMNYIVIVALATAVAALMVGASFHGISAKSLARSEVRR